MFQVNGLSEIVAASSYRSEQDGLFHVERFSVPGESSTDMRMFHVKHLATSSALC
jgi:hypothetical protein